MTINAIISGFVILLLAGCSGTTVVLLPDDNGKVGEVSLKNQAGTQTLSHANESSSSAKHNKMPTPPQIISKEDIRSQFAEVLAVQPATPQHINIQGFASGSADVASQKEVINNVVDIVNNRKSCDIIVIGHCDTVGTNADNEEISKARAANVKQALIDKGIAPECIGTIRFYGESDLVKKTADNVDEPLNRRVEIEVR